MAIYGTIKGYSFVDKLVMERYYYTVEGRRSIINRFRENELIFYYQIIPQYIKRRNIIPDADKPKIIRPESVYDNKPTNGIYKYD